MGMIRKIRDEISRKIYEGKHRNIALERARGEKILEVKKIRIITII